MNVRKKQFILLSVIGAVIGIAIWLIMLLTHNPKALSDGSHSSGIIILNVILSAVFGALCMGGAVVYDIEEWSILRATFTHFVIVFASFVPAAAGTMNLSAPSVTVRLPSTNVGSVIIRS